MYLHLGNGCVARKNEIVAVFDLDNASQSHRTREFLTNAERAGRVVNAAGAELPKSFVITGEKIYLCQFNSSTLAKNYERNL